MPDGQEVPLADLIQRLFDEANMAKFPSESAPAPVSGQTTVRRPGWICTGCRRVWSPLVSRCWHCHPPVMGEGRPAEKR